MNKIYDMGIGLMCESSQPDIEDNFINEIVELVMKVLSIREERIVRSLLKNQLKNDISNYYPELGLLQQYEKYVLDKSSESLISELNLKSGVNHKHATHAKFSDIIDEIKRLYVIRL
jgi:hypothetical protein